MPVTELVGHCNYGASHNLKEDCETLAEGFANIESLGNIKEVLKQCTDEVEFNSKKRDFLDKINQAINGLRPHIGAHSSMFGICIIWGEEAMTPNLEKVIKKNKGEIEKIKSLLEKESYKWVEELRQLELEIDQINSRMEENKRRAMDPNLSPSEKAVLLEEIEADGKLLQQKYEEHRKHSNKFRFDPSRYVSDMVDAMRRAIEGESNDPNGGDDGRGNPNRPRKPNHPDGPFGDGNGGSGSNGNNTWPNGNNSNRNPRKQNQPEQSNQQMLIIGVIALVIIFFLINQKSDHPRHRYEYDY